MVSRKRNSVRVATIIVEDDEALAMIKCWCIGGGYGRFFGLCGITIWKQRSIND